jgi:hypothetical protein
MAPSEHPMTSRLVDAMGIGLDVGMALLSLDCVMPMTLGRKIGFGFVW